MALLSWPIELPATLPIKGLSVKPQDNVIRTAMDAGPKKARRRYTARTVQYSGRFILSAGEYALFKTFYHTVLADGVLRFAFTDPVSLDKAEFRFVEPYGAAAVDGRFEVAVTLERL
jgi:hypothetical protein